VLERSLTVDVLKVVAAQFIVWHHFSAYGPMADTMTLMWPQLMEWLYRYARLAVQVFLVVGGYLAAQSVMHKSIQHPLINIAKRYLRLAPFMCLPWRSSAWRWRCRVTPSMPAGSPVNPPCGSFWHTVF